MPTYKNPGKFEFDAVIVDSGGGGAFIEFPHDVMEVFGVPGRVPVRASFDGAPYRGSLVKMGEACHLLLILKEIREKIGKQFGDKVHVVVELDTEERTIELSEDVSRALKQQPKQNVSGMACHSLISANITCGLKERKEARLASAA